MIFTDLKKSVSSSDLTAERSDAFSVLIGSPGWLFSSYKNDLLNFAVNVGEGKFFSFFFSFGWENFGLPGGVKGGCSNQSSLVKMIQKAKRLTWLLWRGHGWRIVRCRRRGILRWIEWKINADYWQLSQVVLLLVIQIEFVSTWIIKLLAQIKLENLCFEARVFCH